MTNPCDWGMCNEDNCNDTVCSCTMQEGEKIMKEAKTQKIIPLYNELYGHDGPHMMEVFVSTKKNIRITRTRGDMITMVTSKGQYILRRHASLNIYQGNIRGVKVHVTLKVQVGKVIFWS